MIQYIVWGQISCLAILTILAFSCLLWSDIRRLTALMVLGAILWQIWLIDAGFWDELSIVLQSIEREFHKGLLQAEPRPLITLISRSDFWIPLSVNGLVSSVLFFLARQPFYLFCLKSFRRERDVNRVLFVLAFFGSGFAFIVPSIVISIWMARRYENFVVTTEGDPVFHDSSMSYFVARLCYIREVFRGGLREVKNFVFIHPFVKVHSYTFRRGVLALGAIGSGKTNLIYNWFLRPFLSGRTRFLVYDQKGDFSAALGLRDDAVVVSPFLENSAAWWVAKDLDTSTKMVEFLTILGSFDELRESKFFNTAFTDFGTAVFLELKGSKKLDWTFKDLFEMMQDQVRLFEVVKRHRPQAEMFARRDEEIDQARGVLGTIREKLLKIEPIARAWQSGQERFSLSEFFDAGYSGDKRILIVLGKSRYENVNRGFSTSFLEEAIKLLIDAPEGDLDVVVSIDELQTLSRIPSLVTLPRVGRSKGVRLHVGTQDFAVTKKQYERDGGFEGMDNTFKTRFVGSLAGSQVSDEASAMFRKVNKEVWRRDPKTRRFVAHKELNQPALVSGQLSLPEPSLKDPAYFYFKHSDWPILKIAYRIEPLPQNGFEPVPAKWLDDSDFASALGSDDAELEDPEEISISLDGADAGKKRGGGGVKKKASSSSEDGRSPGHGKSSSGDGEASSASKDRGSGDKASLGETSAEPSSSSLKKKGRRSGIKIKKFRR